MKKLNFSSPVQLALYAIEHGMIEASSAMRVRN
jgi:hypothetical protein